MRSGKLSFCFFLFFLSFYNASAQTKKYDSLWKKVIELSDKKGLPKSALAEVNRIYALAKKEKQEAQVIKALVYRITLEEKNNDNDASEKAIQVLEKEAATATEPARSILYSILAERYWSYFQQNRWKLYNHTATVNFKKEDIATWSADDFHKKISDLYLTSLKQEKPLHEVWLSTYDPIILKGNVRYLRPRLYDLLAHRALDYFRNDERDISKPAYAFEIREPDYFAPAAEFANLKITTKDTASLHHKALLIYQKLLQFHLTDARPDALIDADLARIEFVNQYGIMENKDSLYWKSLQDLTNKYQQLPAAAQAWYLTAQWHASKAATYDPLKDTTYRYEYVAAEKICETITAQKDSSEGKINCYNLLNEIHRRNLQLTTEKVNIPSLPFRTLVSYRNFSTVYFRIISLTEDLRKQLENRYDDSYWTRLTTLKPIRSWSQNLPVNKDFQQHTAEVKIDGLPAGSYIILAGVNEKFSLSRNPLAVQYFYVSNISYVNNNQEYFLLHRETGKPLAGATVQTWWNGYDYASRSYQTKKEEKYTVDTNGYLKLKTDSKNRSGNLRLEISYGQDRLFMNDGQYIYYRSEDPSVDEDYEKDNSRLFFFTDRSIYRPGQTVYFKGIAITKDAQTKKSKIISGYKGKLYLYNANNEKVDSLKLTTNEFGSYSGQFRLPENMLNGQFRIEDSDIDGGAHFSVEEYKRPKFQVEYETIKGTYQVNDSVSITGLAKAYAGNTISGAQVKYRVVRTARFLYPWLFWGRGYPRSNDMEITNGVATTDGSGKFVVRFKAIPDLTVNRQFDPVFDYTVIADVTDINGETRSATTIVPVSYKALLLNMSSRFGETIPVDSLKSITISTTNLNGNFEPALVKLSIYPLSAPDRLIRQRYWEQPDQHVLSYDDYVKYFPHDEYANETDYRSWEKGKLVAERTDSTKADARFSIPASPFKAGWYVAEAVTKDKYGQEVKAVFYFQLYDPRSEKLTSPAYIWNEQKNPTIEPGEKNTVSIGSSAGEVFLIQRTGKVSGKPEYRFNTLDQQKKHFTFTAGEDDRGGFSVTHFFVKDNRFYFIKNNVYVPWSNKELTVSYETWRDKTLPGSEEKWKLKISGYKKEQVAAEMLASVYDGSLDQYKMHQWSTPSVWPYYYTNDNWENNASFTDVQSQTKADDGITWKQLDKRYDVFDLPDNYYGYTKGRMMVAADAESQPVSSPLIALQGRVAGVEIAQANGVPGGNFKVQIRGKNSLSDASGGPLYIIDGVPAQTSDLSPDQIASMEVLKDADATAIYGSRGANGVIIITTKGGKKNAAEEIKVRKNFNETAFFFPDLRTDAEGTIEFSFTMPEALTRWKFQALTHTKDLAFGYSTRDIITQKELMVQPNMPRFLREGDKIGLSAKVVNMSDKELKGTLQLQLLDAATMQPVDGLFHNTTTAIPFTASAGQSVPANFTVTIPAHYTSAITYRFVAKAGSISDGEEAQLPVLTNRMLVTETLPMPVRGNTTKNFRFEKLLQSGNSNTLQQHALTVEYTSNPAWYAVQALPYLMEYPYECAEQTFNRFYANALATKIANSTPKLKAVFEKWKTTDTTALLSNLQKNQELKSILLEETPWVLQAQNEAQQKRNIALLFDMLRMEKELTSSLDKLLQSQTSNGGFSWFKGGQDDRYITQYIVSGIGHLQKLEALPVATKEKINTLLKSAIPYLDARLKEDYDQLLKWKVKLGNNHLGYTQIQYLYMRSFFPQHLIPATAQTPVNYYRNQSKLYWLKQNNYMQGMIALALHRNGDRQTPAAILSSLKENAVVSEEMGMYWKQNTGGYYWQEAPVETQSLLIEAFSEITSRASQQTSGDQRTVNDLKTWLLKQKQTQNWRTTKATADACYALLLQSSNWLAAEPVVEINLGDKRIVSTEVTAEAGTGYFKKTFDGEQVKPSMGNISVTVRPGAAAGSSIGITTTTRANTSATTPGAEAPSWGGVYWQYFENLDKITPAATPLRLDKKLFIEKNTDNGPVLQPVNEGDNLRTGDKIKVRIELRVDRDLEYVHMKDMRASCLEPVNVLSSYKWQGGLGYYESTKDASTNFFFSRLPKGTYVFEYPLFVMASGNFSNGVTSIQCMYAPEFSSHSEGVRVNVVN